MTRDDAIDLITEAELEELDEQARESLLLDWWSIDEDDTEFNELPDVLQAELARSAGPDDVRKPHYDALLRIALRRKYLGVKNEYLSSRLNALGRAGPVEGPVERLEPCPCCGFRTLEEQGAYEVCKVCFWEDDGLRDPDVTSGPNHLTLCEARENLARFGAMSESAVGFVLPDGNKRYFR